MAAVSEVTRNSSSLKIRVDRKIFPASGSRQAQPVLKNIAIDIEPRSFVVITGRRAAGSRRS